MTAEFIRDAAATAAILGFFASSWFGWALDKPPVSWRKGLITGAVLSLLTAIAGGLLTWRYWSDGSVFDATTARSFGIIVGIEVALAGLGSWLLTAANDPSWSLPGSLLWLGCISSRSRRCWTIRFSTSWPS